MSAFNVGLSGLFAASKDLDVTGNNIANVGTTGFKYSRAEFGDLFATTTTGLSATAAGQGVRVLNVAQQHTQGTIEFTDNALDLAVSGNGYFVVEDQINGSLEYTRNGEFKLNREGFIVNNNGQFLQGFQAAQPNNLDTIFDTGELTDLQLETGNAVPSATREVDVVVNLPSNATLPTEAWAWPDPTVAGGPTRPDPDSYNYSTAVTVYDSLGTPRTLTMYFVKPDDGAGNPDPLNWDVYMAMELEGDDGQMYMQSANGEDPTGPGYTEDPARLTFTPEGYLAMPDPRPTPLDNDAFVWAITFPDGAPFDNGANQFSPDAANVTTINFGATSADNAGEGTTQYGTQFDINELNQDGFTTGRISTIDIDQQGRVFARYTNGQSSVLGQVAMASFNNNQGLKPMGDNNWAATFAAGDPVYSAAGTGDLGTIQSSALEASNVDLATELVNLIVAQRNFEANSKTISTSDQMTQTVLQIKR